MNVLIVEDNLTSALLLITLVEQIDGFRAVGAATAAEAMDAVARDRFDLVLMDYMLPDGNGLDLAHRIRSKPDHRDAAVVMITSSYERNLRMACVEAGIDEFLNKPVDVAELRLRVLSLASSVRMRRRMENSVDTVFGPLEERLGLGPGALDAVRDAVVHVLARQDTAAYSDPATELLAREWARFAASVGTIVTGTGFGLPPEPPLATADLREIVLPETVP